VPEILTLQHSVLQSPIPTSRLELDEGLSWYAVYTCARHEKRVKQQLDLRQIRCALPLYRAVHRWKDRRKELDLPLFPSYIFVNLSLANRVRVLEIPGVVSFVCSQGKPLVLPRQELGPFLADHVAGRGIEPHPFVQVGRRAAAVLSGGRLCLGPRFMVIARKAPILRGFGVIPSPAR
jgi:hypothetical protein